jgi:hypothetical protein
LDDLARIPFGIGRELRNGLGWNRWIPSITSEHAGFVAIGAMSRMKIEAGFLVSVALIAQLDAREETRLPGKREAGSSALGRGARRKLATNGRGAVQLNMTEKSVYCGAGRSLALVIICNGSIPPPVGATTRACVPVAAHPTAPAKSKPPTIASEVVLRIGVSCPLIGV